MAVLILYSMFALLLSMVLPSARTAGMLTGALIVGDFLIKGLAQNSETLEKVVEYMPLNYLQGGAAIDGIKWEWFAGLLAAALICALLAWWRFQGRDIRVGGEGGWRLPSLGKLLGRSG
jgi:hypothetical protein